jgi:putative aminopeptidase FrvX
MDEVGLMLTGVEPGGVLNVARVGGVTPNQLAGKAFWVGRERVPGVIGLGHALTPPAKA